VPIATGNLSFDVAAIAAENQRQSAIGVSNAQNHDGRPGIASVPLPPPSPAATIAANIAWAKAMLAAANAAGITPAPYLMMLRELGAPVYP
jgi:hypothetical protein